MCAFSKFPRNLFILMPILDILQVMCLILVPNSKSSAWRVWAHSLDQHKGYQQDSIGYESTYRVTP